MWFQSGGNIIDHPVNGRVVAVDPRDLHGARKPVPASGGWQKHEVIRGAMRLMTPKRSGDGRTGGRTPRRRQQAVGQGSSA